MLYLLHLIYYAFLHFRFYFYNIGLILSIITLNGQPYNIALRDGLACHLFSAEFKALLIKVGKLLLISTET